jgi:hypothetical protein
MNDGSISTDLYQFFAAYFHQDWDLEAEDWEGIVDSRRSSPGTWCTTSVV